MNYLALILRRVCTKFINSIISIISGRFVLDKKLAFWGGLNDDNIIVISKHFSEYTLYVVNKKNESEPRWLSDCSNVRVINFSFINVLKLIFTCKAIFYTHGFYNGIKLSNVQYLVNLWHGMPIKKIGEMSESTSYGRRVRPSFDYILSTHYRYSLGFATGFACDPKKCVVVGSPRNDIMLDNSLNFLDRNVEIFFEELCIENDSVILWLPTYRSTVIGECRKDGDDIQLTQDFWIKLNDALKYSELTLLVKPHPMDIFVTEKEDLSNIRFITDEMLSASSVTLYALLKNAKYLISDVSSVIIDYMIISNKIIIFFPDFSLYKNNRGFFDGGIYDDFEVIENTNEFVDTIRNIHSKFFDEIDIDKYHRYSDKFCLRLKEILML